MTTLTRKLIRTIRSTLGQFLALIFIVTLGVMIYIGMNTAFHNLSRSQEQFYRECRFADYTFMVVKAPETVVARIEAVPGVVKATGRIQKDVPIDKAGHDRAVGRLTGYPLPAGDEVNRLQLLSGRGLEEDSSGTAGALLDPQYAQANRLQPGDRVTIIANGKKATLTMIGTAISPEFVYPLRDAATIIPEPERFGIIMIPQKELQQIMGLPGQINQIAIDLAPGADETLVKKQIEEILKPYGNIASFPRRNQLSHATLQAELDGLKTMSGFLPMVFFLIAAAIQYVILSRLIKSQRLPIGVMKALGYDNRHIIGHYTSYALLVSICGAVSGTVLGVGMASGMSALYAQYFNLPRAVGGVNGMVVVYSFLICMLVGAAAGLFASRSVAKINPAESMRPEPPISGRHTPLEKWTWLWSRLNSSWKMSVRSAFRNRVRFIVTVAGVMFSVILLIFAMFSNDAVDYMLHQNFALINRYDYMVRFTEPVKYTELADWNRWEEVQILEPVLEVPVKLKLGEHIEDELLIGLEEAGQLKRIFDKDGRQQQIPSEGLLIRQKVAEKLGVKVGDLVQVETTLGIGPARTSWLKIVGFNDPMTSTGSYISLSTANQLLGEREVSSGVMLKLDAAEMENVERRLQDMNGVSSVMSPAREQASFAQFMDTMILFISIMILMAGLLGMAIVYNTSVMTFQERKREAASLRVLGYSTQEVAALIRKEAWVQAMLGIIIGLPAGKALGAAYVASVNMDFFSLPVVIYPRTYVIAALAVIIFVWLGQQLAVRKINQLDMVEALKNRD